MAIPSGLKSLYLKLIITSFLFLILLGGFFFALKFYEKKIIQQIEKINSLKEEIARARAFNKRELSFQQWLTLFEKQTGKEVSVILFDLQQKVNPDFEKTKNLLLKKFNDENWKILNSSFNFEERRIDFSLEIPSEDLNKFFDFLENESLIIKIKDFKIEKGENSYKLQISLNLK